MLVMPVLSLDPFCGAYPYIRAGTTVQVFCGLYNHLGIADGMGGVIHARKDGLVVRETEAKFANGKHIQINNEITSKDLYAAYLKAESLIGKRYNLFSAKCEHFVREVHGMKIESKQLKTGLLIGGVIICSLLINAKYGKNQI